MNTLLSNQKLRTPESMLTLSMSYLNAGYECRALNQLTEAKHWFQSGWTFAYSNLGDHQVTQLLKEQYGLLDNLNTKRVVTCQTKRKIMPVHTPRKSIRFTVRHCVDKKNELRKPLRGRLGTTLSPPEKMTRDAFLTAKKEIVTRTLCSSRTQSRIVHHQMATVIQKWVRMHQAKSLYRLILEAAHLIQRVYRRYLRSKMAYN